MTEVGARGGIDALGRSLRGADVVVDALLGTGARGAPTGLVAERSGHQRGRAAGLCARPALGAPADGGPVPEPSCAPSTVTFGLPKLGLYLLPGALHAGRVEVADLGVPRAWLGGRLGLVEAADVRAALPPRPADAHKGRYGHLLVVAGSIGRTGAAVLACRGALRAGTGLVTCAAPASQQPVVAAQLAEAMTEPLPETAAQTLSAKAVERIVELAARMDAVAVGPGVGLDPETQAAVRKLVRAAERPMVVDADALTALAGHLALVREARAPRLLTPHPGEAARLLGTRSPRCRPTASGARGRSPRRAARSSRSRARGPWWRRPAGRRR